MGFLNYIETSLSEKAKEVAKKAHKGQKRKSGEDYIVHPIAVADIVKQYKDSEFLDEILAAAYLHDTLEDTELSKDFIQKTFGELVFSLVEQLTSNKEEMAKIGKAEYLIKKMSKMSNWALVIKLADRLHNTSDLKNSNPTFRRKYIRETKQILNALKETRNLTMTQIKLVRQIKRNLDKSLREL